MTTLYRTTQLLVMCSYWQNHWVLKSQLTLISGSINRNVGIASNWLCPKKTFAKPIIVLWIQWHVWIVLLHVWCINTMPMVPPTSPVSAYLDMHKHWHRIKRTKFRLSFTICRSSLKWLQSPKHAEICSNYFKDIRLKHLAVYSFAYHVNKPVSSNRFYSDQQKWFDFFFESVKIFF